MIPFSYKSFLVLIILSPVSLLGQTPTEAGASSVTLRQCYEWAKERSEDLKIRGEDIEQSQARARRALGAALPQADWIWTDTWQDPSGVDKLEDKGFSGFVEKDQVESRFAVQQNLFSGLKEFSARAGFKRETERDRLRLQRAERELFEKIAQAFYAAVGYEIDRANTMNAFKLAEDRVKELKGFLRLGKARDSEVFTARARAAALNGELDQIHGNIYAARQDLSYLTGRDFTALPLQDDEVIPSFPPPVEGLLSKARERGDVRAQREDVAARKLRVRYERGNYWPSADLTGTYYTQRATFLKDIDWDVVLSVDFPLYQGGQVAAGVREALSAYRQSVLTLRQMERRAVFAVSKTHGELVAALQEVKSMEEAAESARQSYDALLKEYRLGLVTNLDVLQALDFLQAQEKSRDAARIKAKRLSIQLKVATEELP